jgi:hypothetical protein
MNNSELNKLLQRVPPPERNADYWESFPTAVTRRLRSGRSSGISRPARRFPLLAWGFGLATACVLLGFVFGLWKGQDTSNAQELALLRKMYQETASVFPNQLRAIVCDDQGVHLVLAEQANVPSSPPVFIKICDGGKCRRFITFSGEQIQFNGELCDVLVDAQRHVILAGRKLVWSSAPAMAAKVPYRIEARQMEEWL